MLRCLARCRAPFARFMRDTSGASTLEFVLWIPLILVMFATLLDFSHSFTVNSTMWNQARIAARGLSMHELTVAEAEALIRNGLQWTQHDVAISIVEDRDQVSVTLRMPIAQSGVVNVATGTVPGDWVARVAMLREPV